MGRLVFVVAMLAPGVAVAGPQEDANAAQEADFGDLGTAFDLPRDRAAFEKAEALGRAVEFETTDVPYVTEWEAIERLRDHALTSSIPTADHDLCRTASVLALVKRRQSELRLGWAAGFTFEIACEGSTISGLWNSYNTLPDGGLVSMDHLGADGGSLGGWRAVVDWQALAPDPGDAEQWLAAVEWSIVEIVDAIKRVRAAIPTDEGELVRSLVQSLAESELRTVQGYPAFPDDDTVLAAQVTWMTGVIADLERGDLKRLVERGDPNVPTKTSKKKSYKKKTKTIEKRWKKTWAKRLANYDAVLKAFRAAHDLRGS